MKKVFLLVIALAVALLALAHFNESAIASDPLSLQISRNARLLSGGDAILVKIRYFCAVDLGVVTDAFIVVSQDVGESEFNIFFEDVICDGSFHTLLLEAKRIEFNPPFHRGKAFVSGQIAVEDPDTSEVTFVSASETVKVR